MARPTGKDHAEINLDIWGDDDWLDLTPPAQHLYFVLWTSPQLSYCGAGTWHPGRIASVAKGWTTAAVETAAAELSAELFLIIDTNTEEFLLRSWIKHDALWKKPNMAVSMANARAALASRTLRGVVVHEVLKIKARNEAEAKTDSEVAVSSGWQRDSVKNLLAQKPIDPATLEPFTPSLTLGLTPSATPRLTPDLTLRPTVNPTLGVNPPSNPMPTPTPSPLLPPSPGGGYVSREPHQGDESETPRPHCPEHEENHDGPCRRCKSRREWDEAHATAAHLDEVNRKRRLKEVIADCPMCDQNGMVELGEGLARCKHQVADHA